MAALRCNQCDRLSYLSPAGFCLDCQLKIDHLRENRARTSPGPGVGVLLVWTGRMDEVRDALAPVLSDLYARGILAEHPDGASEGWEWKG